MAGRSTGRDHGVLILDKPAGPSSHEVVAWVRRVLGERRVGHCGTLDPAATGVLVVCVGEATKLVPWLTDDDKAYAATIALGRSTSTADAAGETVAIAAVTAADVARAAAALGQLQGPLELPPPRVSAVRVDGVRAHARVRAGEDFELPARTMVVHAAVLDGMDPAAGLLRATFEVGKGTYIRSLAEHLGALVGVPAHLAALRRLRTGAFGIAAAAAAGGIVAVDGGTRPDGKPRHRLAPADGVDPGALAARLRAALLPIPGAAPASWTRGRMADAARFARLCNGLDLDRAEIAFEGQDLPDGPRDDAADPSAPGPLALVVGPGPAMSGPWVIARLDPGSLPGPLRGPLGRVRPLRVLDPDAGRADAAGLDRPEPEPPGGLVDA